MQALYDHLLEIANVQVRSVATIGGNLMITRQNAATANPFPSDLFMVLATLGAQVELIPSDPSKGPEAGPILKLPDFDSMPGGYVLVWVQLPLTRESEYVKTYKVARRTQNSHAIVNAGFRVHFDANDKIDDASVVLGGIAGMPLVVDVSSLIGQPWTWPTWQLLEEAVTAAAKAGIVPMPDGVSDQYRLDLAVNLALKFFVWLALQVNPTVVQPTWASAGEDYVRPVSSGQTYLTSYPDEWPVGEAIPSLSSDIQTTGEALYTQDLPVSATTLEAAYVYSQQLFANFAYAFGGVSALLAAVQKLFPGVYDFVTAADVPGQNVIGLGRRPRLRSRHRHRIRRSNRARSGGLQANGGGRRRLDPQNGITYTGPDPCDDDDRRGACAAGQRGHLRGCAATGLVVHAYRQHRPSRQRHGLASNPRQDRSRLRHRHAGYGRPIPLLPRDADRDRRAG